MKICNKLIDFEDESHNETNPRCTVTGCSCNGDEKTCSIGEYIKSHVKSIYDRSNNERK